MADEDSYTGAGRHRSYLADARPAASAGPAMPQQWQSMSAAAGTPASAAAQE